MLELCNVTKRFGKHVAVDGVSLTLEPGDFLGLIGPNGAGKSTTLRMVTGQLRPTEGMVQVNGVDLEQDPLQARRLIGYVPEYIALYDYLTGAEYLDFVGEVKGIEATARRREGEELLELLELGDERDRLIRTYSQGMRRKVALAGALLGRPPILILDEALNGLDPTTNHRLKGFLRDRAAGGMAILLSSHVLEVLERICNRIAVLRHGRIVDLRNEAELERIRQQDGGLERHFLALMAEPGESVATEDRRDGVGGRR